MFKLDSKLKEDCILVDSLQLSDLLLMNDSKYPWFILVPRMPDLVEVIDLDLGSQRILLDEINYMSDFLKNDLKSDKINIGALGNMVRQLHIHIIARYEDDHSFPSPVWSGNVAVKYSDLEKNKIIEKYNDFKQRN